tara:strand:+ start:2428 stop:2613 length:186 start_codon:yes stop_codon:yes gene_type:complete
MDIEKVLYHLREADRELNRLSETNSFEVYGHQAYLVAMSHVYDFVNSIKPTERNAVIRDDY